MKNAAKLFSVSIDNINGLSSSYQDFVDKSTDSSDKSLDNISIDSSEYSTNPREISDIEEKFQFNDSFRCKLRWSWVVSELCSSYSLLSMINSRDCKMTIHDKIR